MKKLSIPSVETPYGWRGREKEHKEAIKVKRMKKRREPLGAPRKAAASSISNHPTSWQPVLREF